MKDEFDLKVFRERLLMLLEEKGLTYAKAGSLTGICESTFGNYLNAHIRSAPMMKNMYKIAKGLGVSLDWLTGLSDRRGNTDE